ncbi:MAG: M67 family metallopeptidase, partial [Phormidesmis sp.]
VYPEECCGLMVGKIKSQEGVSYKSIVELVALDNHWTPDAIAPKSETLESETLESKTPADNPTESPQTKQRRYYIDPKDMLQVQRQARDQGLTIVGVYHSHPDHVAEPSECDRALAWPEYAYIIVSVKRGKAVDIKNWALDSDHQFQPEAMKVSPSSAKDRMPVSA